VQLSVPPPGFVEIANVIGAEPPRTACHRATVTILDKHDGCCVHTAPGAPPFGCVENESCDGAP